MLLLKFYHYYYNSRYVLRENSSTSLILNLNFSINFFGIFLISNGIRRGARSSVWTPRRTTDRKLDFKVSRKLRTSLFSIVSNFDRSIIASIRAWIIRRFLPNPNSNLQSAAGPKRNDFKYASFCTSWSDWFSSTASVNWSQRLTHSIGDWPVNFGRGIFGNFIFAEFVSNPEVTSWRNCFQSVVSCCWRNALLSLKQGTGNRGMGRGRGKGERGIFKTGKL